MKTPSAFTADVRRRLTNRWHQDLTAEATGCAADVAFPHLFPLGRPSAADIRGDYASVHARTVEWQDWARDHDVSLTYAFRLAAGGTKQSVPTHAAIDSIDHAAAVVGEGWLERLARGRQRRDVLTARYPGLSDAGSAVRMVDAYSSVDFGLLLTVTSWYLEDPSRALGVTPRQVPIPGVHAKWLQSHMTAVLALTGLGDLGLLPAHPQRIHFTYLDPTHRSQGRRIHDSATVGDAFVPAYLPRVVIVSENKDTAIHFPQLPGSISVEGVGRGGRTLASFPWLRDAPVVVYWGDMDRDGYEILNGYRIDFDRDLDSILMDESAYEQFEPFGTDHDQHGRNLVAATPRVVDRLRLTEDAVYRRILDPECSTHRRVEQERIPLQVALEAVREVVRRTTHPPAHSA